MSVALFEFVCHQGAGIFNTTPLAVSLMPMTQPGSLIHPQQHDTQPAVSFKRFPVLVE
ncbi:hypothetical protein BDR03DRAFT_940582 [Suillus americanus]|nr:hypothetical protein BDR03DRAFT_940582 [Suillus americanus]